MCSAAGVREVPSPLPCELPARACFLSSLSAPWAREGAGSEGSGKETELGVQAAVGLGNSQLEMGEGRRMRGRWTLQAERLDRRRVQLRGV